VSASRTGAAIVRRWRAKFAALPTGCNRIGQPLFRNDLTRTAKFGWEILQLWQAVAHRQHRLGIVDVNAGSEGQRQKRGGKYIDKARRRMIGHQVPAHFEQY
jgi:hypothetical protein